MSQLKYEGIATGTRIRAYDFPPIPERTDHYVEGVIDHVSEEYGYKAYYVNVEVDTSRKFTNRKAVLVPMESDCDYDGRVIVLEGEPA